MLTESVVEITNLAAGYNRSQILKGIDLKVKQGEAVGIAGPNGAGKTTLFKVILGLVPVRQGRISVLGRDLSSGTDRAWVRREIGYVPQQTLPGKLPVSVHDAVLLGKWGKEYGFFRKPRQSDHEAVNQTLKRVGLADLEWQDCRKLSGGEQQKVSIARALVRKAAILLLDEPTTYLDRNFQTEILELLKQIRNEGRLTLITISHDPAHLKAISDRIYQLEQGFLQVVNDEFI
jgi:ABC-type Mn2+/Zn2+ transport system ATPase subunit